MTCCNREPIIVNTEHTTWSPVGHITFYIFLGVDAMPYSYLSNIMDYIPCFNIVWQMMCISPQCRAIIIRNVISRMKLCADIYYSAIIAGSPLILRILDEFQCPHPSDSIHAAKFWHQDHLIDYLKK